MLIGVGLSISAIAADGPPVIQTARAVLDLDRAAADSGPRVEVEAVVTFFEPESNMFFVQDETAGVYVFQPNAPDQLRHGQKIRVHGVAGKGGYSRVILADSVEVIGDGKMPKAPASQIGDVVLGASDSQWVGIEGVVQYDGKEWLHRVLEVHDGRNAVRVRIKDFETLDPTSLLDARVRIQGVAGGLPSPDDQSGFVSIYCPDPTFIEVIDRPDQEPFETPLILLKDLVEWHGGANDQHQQLHRTRGVATYQSPGRFIAISSGGASLVVVGTSTNHVMIGDEVDAVGFLAANGGRWLLANGDWRITGKREEAAPLEIMGIGDLDGLGAGEFVRLTARLQDWSQLADGRLLGRFDFGPTVIEGVMSRSEEHTVWLPGSTYELTGTLISEMGRMGLPPKHSLYLANGITSRLVGRSEAGIGRTLVNTLIGVLLLLIAVVTALVWRQIRKERAASQGLEAALAFSQAQLVRSKQERERIGRDLHDGMIQSMYAIGMGLEESRRLISESPDIAADKLVRSRDAMNHLIQDVRQFIVGLEPASIKGLELRTAIKSTLLTMGETAANRVSLDMDLNVLENLSSKQATEVFHICNEAISNSLRHSSARSVEVSLRSDRENFVLEIIDDGGGFDLESVSAEANGLHNMKRRARQLGVRLVLAPRPGEGTTVTVVFPTT